ncbi:MAG TPA: hypothetical protein EYP81_03095 [Thermodesulfobacteriaceae bacterium]|nr:hypothetical protein [Thermodesulfobacteriaceae bacterium]
MDEQQIILPEFFSSQSKRKGQKNREHFQKKAKFLREKTSEAGIKILRPEGAPRGHSMDQIPVKVKHQSRKRGHQEKENPLNLESGEEDLRISQISIPEIIGVKPYKGLEKRKTRAKRAKRRIIRRNFIELMKFLNYLTERRCLPSLSLIRWN